MAYRWALSQNIMQLELNSTTAATKTTSTKITYSAKTGWELKWKARLHVDSDGLMI